MDWYFECPLTAYDFSRDPSLPVEPDEDEKLAHFFARSHEKEEEEEPEARPDPEPPKRRRHRAWSDELQEVFDRALVALYVTPEKVTPARIECKMREIGLPEHDCDLSHDRVQHRFYYLRKCGRIPFH